MMGSDISAGGDPFQATVALLYEAALDEALWPEAFGAVDEFCGLKGGQLSVIDGVANDAWKIGFAYAYQGGEPFLDPIVDYMENYGGASKNITRLLRAPLWTPTHNEQLFTDGEKRVSAIYNEFQPKWECGNQVGVVVDRPDGGILSNGMVIWTVRSAEFHSRDDGWQPDVMERISGLLPHLRQSIRMRCALVSAGSATPPFLADLLQSSSSPGVVLLDRDGSILSMNDAAEQSLRHGGTLHDRGGGLHAHCRREDGRLQQCLAAALPRPDQTAVATDLALPRVGRPPLTLHVCPVPPHRWDFCAPGVAVAVLVRDPETPFEVDPESVGRVLGLTKPESRIAALLVRGLTIPEIATALYRSEHTVRWTLKRAMARTGSKRQADLVRLVVQHCPESMRSIASRQSDRG